MIAWDFNLANLIPVFLSAALTYALYRVNKSQDEREYRFRKLETEFNQFKLDVAMQYIRSPVIDELREEIKAARLELHELSASVNRLIGRLNKA